MSQECEPLVDSTSAGGLGASHPSHLTQEMLVAPTDSDGKNTVRAAIVPIACWRLDDLRFEFDSSFVRPDAAEELAHLARLIKVHPGAPLCVFGHADPVGNDEYNKKLSGRRATAVYAMLVRDADLWDQLYRQAHGNDNWASKKVIPAIAADLGMTGTVNEADPGTRKQLYLAYMDKHCRDGQGAPFRVRKSDFLAQGADAGGKGDYQGCGEFNPVLMFSQAENDAYSRAKDKAERDAANAPNRRVVIYLFRPGSKVSPARWPCPPVKGGGAACRQRFWSDAAVRRQFQPLRREYAKTRDTFACRFYERIAAGSPCEAGVERSVPKLLAPEQPGSSNWIPLHSLWAYVVTFRGGGSDIERLERFTLKEGRLCDGDGKAQLLDCNRQAYFYFSHRDDLLTLDRQKFWLRDRSGLPLLGPVCVPCGPDADIDLDIWQQNDWAIVRAAALDGMRPEVVKMTEWRDDYKPGWLDTNNVYHPGDDYRQKQSQEKWKGDKPINLIQFGSPGGTPMWVGTLSALPSQKAKLLLLHKDVHALTYNELAPTGQNQDLPGHHVYNREKSSDLLAIAADGQDPATIDALPEPPPRCVLPGDICWYDQGATNNCGAFSFAAAMNYWLPYLNNSVEHDGAWYAQSGRVDQTINGARTPDDIVDTAPRYQMSARDNDAEDIDAARGLKLVKLWIQAGVPVLILVEEYYNIWSLHWKTVVGYEGNRFFMNNSGADDEAIKSHRTPGTEYEKSPAGNDVDSADAFWQKWHQAGGNVVDLITSVDRCTFIPLYPQNPMFGGAVVR